MGCLDIGGAKELLTNALKLFEEISIRWVLHDEAATESG